jgi:IclR family transcriptional regulator, pca regulon regulatory protein
MRAPPPPGGSNPRYSASLPAGIAILGCFTPERPLLGISDVSRELDLGRSMAHRYMATLTELGFLEQDASRKYRLAARAADLGAAALDSHPLRRQSARAVLEELRGETGFTASLGVLLDGEVLYLERLRGNGKGQREIDLGILGLRAGCRLPAYCTATGKLLLAGLPGPERNEHIAHFDLTRRGPCSITSMSALRQELRNIETAGVALSDRELSPVLLSIAAPVRDDAGTAVAAVALEAHTAAATPEGLLRDTAAHLNAAAARFAEILSQAAGSTGAHTRRRRKPANGAHTQVGPAAGFHRARKDKK